MTPQIVSGDKPFDLFRRDMPNIGLARRESPELFRVDIESEDGKVFFAKPEHQGKPDIPQPHHSDAGFPGSDEFNNVVFQCYGYPFDADVV